MDDHVTAGDTASTKSPKRADQEMVEIKSICPSCSSPVDIAVGQAVRENRITWWEAFRCSNCGCQQESDGKDQTPEDIRQAILIKHGEWCLVISEVKGTSLIRTLTRLRDALQLSLAETGHLKERLPGKAATGTRAEMEWLSGVIKQGRSDASAMQITVEPNPQ